MPHSSGCPAPRIAVADAPTTKPLPEVLEFMQILWRLVHGLEQRSKRMAVECGVTTPQRLVIRMVGLYPGISARELAILLHVHPSTVTGVLQRLQRQGLLARRVHPDDGRRALLTLTADGRRVDRLRKGTAEGAVGDALWRLSRHDRDCTRRALNLIAERVERASR